MKGSMLSFSKLVIAGAILLWSVLALAAGDRSGIATIRNGKTTVAGNEGEDSPCLKKSKRRKYSGKKKI